MENLLLYAVTVLIWGSTYLVITFQLQGDGVTTAVAWRFLLAAALLLLWCRLRRISLVFTPRQYGWILLQGLGNFSLNYWMVYLAEQRIPSGLVAVTFTCLMIFNMIGARLCFGQRISHRAVLGAAAGLAGVALVFWPELARFSGGSRALAGLGLALLGTLFSCCGNLLSIRTRSSGVGVIPSLTIGMAGGGLSMLLLSWLQGESLTMPLDAVTLGALLYLSLFGSVIAFAAYLTLINRVGAGAAAYNGVLIPIVALALSTAFEDYHWHPAAVAGVGLSLAGNLLVMQGRRG